MISEHKKIKDRNEIIGIVKKVLDNQDKYVILDTETTGLGSNRCNYSIRNDTILWQYTFGYIS